MKNSLDKDFMKNNLFYSISSKTYTNDKVFMDITILDSNYNTSKIVENFPNNYEENRHTLVSPRPSA